MGNYVFTGRNEGAIDTHDGQKQGQKRHLDEEFEDEHLNTPKRKKLKSTSRYIYETLFVNGESSDVTIVALGRHWPLHKVYLSQCGYFSSMFSGSWKESSLEVIHMDIPDDNIDIEALELSFGSLYQDEVLIKPTHVVGVLATATLLALDGLLQQCICVMKESISAKSVCTYHEAALMYTQEEVLEHCSHWLQRNLMTAHSVQLLRDISIRLMEKLIINPDLFVMKVEMDVYSLLKKWLYVHLCPSWLGEWKDMSVAEEVYFKQLEATDGYQTFLESPDGQSYVRVFQQIRLQYIVNDMASAKVLEQDKIIPMEWLLSVYRKQWLQVVSIEQGHDKGPTSKKDVNFDETCMRCGRILERRGEYCWRWTGYGFGIDILVSFTSSHLVVVKRNTNTQNTVSAVSLQPQRHVLYRIQVATFDSLGQTKYFKSTGIKKLSLGKDEEVVVMSVDRKVIFPLYLSCNFLVYTPLPASTGTTTGDGQSHQRDHSPSLVETANNPLQLDDDSFLDPS